MSDDLINRLHIFAADPVLGGVIAEAADHIEALERQRDELLEALEKIVAKDKAVSFERCMDCDYPKKCGTKTGCFSIKDHSPIANAAVAKAKKQGK